MPSWCVHSECAGVLGFDVEVCKRVDRDIDVIFHDYGRRKPKAGSIFERIFNPSLWLSRLERKEDIIDAFKKMKHELSNINLRGRN